MMKILSGEEVFPFIHGVLSCSLSEDGLVEFHRFTDLQMEVYRKAGEREKLNYDDRANASSGVMLEMVTDSEILGMNFQLTAACRPIAGFDLYVDGVLYDHWYTEELFYNVLCFDLPEGMHRVQVFFPWSAITKLRRVVLSEGAAASPVTGRRRALAFGDSITQGYIGKHPSLSYVNHMVRELDMDFVNQAIGGYYFDRETLDPALSAFRPELITVAYGTNDYSLMTDPESFAANCREFTQKLVRLFPEAKILGLLPIHRNDCRNLARNKMNEFKLDDGRRVIKKIYESFPNITVLEDQYFPKHNDFFAPDSLHPNDLGFMFYGQAVTKAVKELFG